MQVKGIQYLASEPVHPQSVCSRPCGPGEAMYLLDTHCCWTCARCHVYQYLPTVYECKDCPDGWIPNADKTSCVEITIVYLRFSDGLAIGAMVFASVGIVLTGFVTVEFIIHNNTPIVKASGRELSFVLLFGIFLCYSMTFILILKPTKWSCGVQKFGLGFCFSICYSAILTKTNRISRIFRAGKRTVQRPKFISPESQLVICGAVVSFQIFVGAMWILLRPPEAIEYYANRDDHQLVCTDSVGLYNMIGFTYPIMLVIVCTFYAILTRKIPEAFNESKYIGFTMYTTCIIWLAFVTIYFSISHDIKLRISTMCYSISLSATVALVCMFAPKVYVILAKPQYNVRKAMATNATRSCTSPCQYSATPSQQPFAGNIY